MNNYDTFNPTIPETEETIQTLTLPPIPEEPAPEPKRKAQRQARQKRLRPWPNRLRKKVPAIPFKERVKAWAGSQTVRWISGLFLGFSVYTYSFLSSHILSRVPPTRQRFSIPGLDLQEKSPTKGRGGARLAEFLINECFGLGSFVIVFWLIAMSMKLLLTRPKFKSVDFTIKSLVALITVSLIIGLLTIGLSSP